MNLKTSGSTIKHINKSYIHIMILRTLKLFCNMQALNIYIYVMFENNDCVQNPKRGPTLLHVWVNREGFEMGTLGG